MGGNDIVQWKKRFKGNSDNVRKMARVIICPKRN